jgi:hypothetical protein
MKKGKQFILEKKNQKTFACLAFCRKSNKSFLVLFFKKELLSCFFGVCVS